MVRAILLVVLALTAAASVNAVPFGFNAFCNYPCHKDYQPGCLPQQFGMAACAQTRIGHNGAFPRIEITASGHEVAVNGGVPQAANMTKHMASLAFHLATWVPDVNFTGNIVIDFEVWTPIWELNRDPSIWHGKRYQTYSEKLARAQHPHLNATAITAIAKRDFEAAAISFFVTTLEFFRAARPHARAGFYGFPGNMVGACVGVPARCGYDNPTIGPPRRALNDGLAAIWNASGALYPSIYFIAQEKRWSNATWMRLNAASVNGTVVESIRLSETYSKSASAPLGIPVIPYAWALHNGVQPLDAEAQAVVNTAVWRPPLSTGLVLWGGQSRSARGKRVVEVETAALEHIVGPSIHAAQRATARCSAQRCSGHGWCDAIDGATGCICVTGWSGASCDRAA
jgi:hypothetical protein